MKFLFATTLIFASVCCFAQRQNVYFFKNSGKKVSLRDSADYVRVVREPDADNKLYNVMEFYLNGTPKFTGKSSTIDPVSLRGQGVSYYPNGKRKLFANYIDDHMQGVAILNYPNGKTYMIKEYVDPPGKTEEVGDSENYFSIKFCADSAGKATVTDGNGYYREYDDHFKYIVEEGKVQNGKRDSTWKGADHGMKITFTENYQSGVLKTAQATDSSGKIFTYQQRSVLPRFKGGVQAFYNYLGRNIVYPENARRDNIQGKVILSFIVNKDGKITDIKVVQSVADEIDKEAIRVLENSKWIPGTMYGKPVNAIYTIPIAFALQGE